MFKISRPLRGVVHLQFKTQAAMTRTMMRMQEFYESPYPQIAGHAFTVEQFRALYCADHGSPFSYYTDWFGFNIPGTALREFERAFRGQLTLNEKSILALHDLDYLIATCDAEDCLDHEIAHAMFALDPYYRRICSSLVRGFIKKNPREAAKLKAWLLQTGYTESVLVDEFNAYLATTTAMDWNTLDDPEPFPASVAATLYEEGHAFRREFKRNKFYLTKTSEDYKKCLIEIDRKNGKLPPEPSKPRSAGAKARGRGTVKKRSRRARASRRTAR